MFQLHTFQFIKKKIFESSENFYNKAISLPIFFDLKENQVKRICNLITKVIEKSK